MLGPSDGGSASPTPQSGLASSTTDGLPWTWSVRYSIGDLDLGAITAREAYVGGARTEAHAKALAVTRVVYAIHFGYPSIRVNWQTFGKRNGKHATVVSLDDCPDDLRAMAKNAVVRSGPAGADRNGAGCTCDRCGAASCYYQRANSHTGSTCPCHYPQAGSRSKAGAAAGSPAGQGDGLAVARQR